MLNNYYIVPSTRTDLIDSDDNAMSEPLYSINGSKMILKTKIGIDESVDFLEFQKYTHSEILEIIKSPEWTNIEEI